MHYIMDPTPDISPLLRFCWHQPIHYKIDDSKFPLETREERGQYVGIAENIGHVMTLRMLTDDTKKVINQSNVTSVGLPLE